MLPVPVTRLLILGGVLTGSRAFGVAKEDSDWDIIIYSDNIPEWITSNSTYRTCSNIVKETGNNPKYDYNIFGKYLIDITRVTIDNININLFEYCSSNQIIMDKFKELNNRICEYSKNYLSYKINRIHLFTSICIDIGIAESII